MLIVNRSIVSPTLNINPSFFVIPLSFFWGEGGIIDLQCYQVIFHPNFNHP